VPPPPRPDELGFQCHLPPLLDDASRDAAVPDDDDDDDAIGSERSLAMASRRLGTPPCWQPAEGSKHTQAKKSTFILALAHTDRLMLPLLLLLLLICPLLLPTLLMLPMVTRSSLDAMPFLAQVKNSASGEVKNDRDTSESKYFRFRFRESKKC